MNSEFLEELIKTEGITVEQIGTWIWVSGNTKPYKEKLKDHKFQWSKVKNMWYFHEGKRRRYYTKEFSIEEIKHKYPWKVLEKTRAV